MRSSLKRHRIVRPYRATLIGLLLFLVLAAPGLRLPLGRDGGNFLFIGNELLDGALPYRDIWDNKPPAVFFCYALAAALSPTIAGQETVVAVLSLLALGLTLICTHRAITGPAGQRRGGVPALLLGISLPLGLSYWLAGQAEVFALPFSAFGWWALQRHLRRPQPELALLAGLSWGCLPLFKPHFLLIGILPLLSLLGSRAAARQRLLWLGLAIPGSLLLLGLMLPGAGADAWQAVVTFNLHYSRSPFPLFRYLQLFLAANAPLGILLIVTTGSAAWICWSHRNRAILRTGCFWFLGSLAAVVLPGKYWLYHWLIIFPPAVFVLDLLGRRLRSSNHTRFLAPGTLFAMLVALIILPAGLKPALDFRFASSTAAASSWHVNALFPEDIANSYDRQQLTHAARLVQQLCRPDETIQLFGYDGILYLLAQRHPSSRFFYDFPLFMLPPDNALGQRYRQDFFQDISQRPPAVVIVALSDVNPVEAVSSAQQLHGSPALQAWLEREYHPVPGTGAFLFFVRNTPPAP